jgi:formate-dependent phosphoribosylglycinamide formyltransferase (GAR transformylase)
MKRILILGSSYSALPIIKKVKEKGFYTVICGMNENDPGHLIGDESVFYDYSSLSDLELILKDINFDAVVPTCNDRAYSAYVYLSSAKGFSCLDDPQRLINLHDKSGFRKLLGILNLPRPRIWNLTELQSTFFPVMVKPVDSFSGIGISRVDNIAEIDNAVALAKEASPSRNIVIEEYVEGTLHSISLFIDNGKVNNVFFVDEYCTVYSYQVNKSNCPSKLTESLKKDVVYSCERIIDYLEIRSGLLHVQFIVRGEVFYLIEAMRRCPGDLFPRLIELGTGFDYYDHYLSYFLKLNVVESLLKKSYIGRFTLSTGEATIFSNICISGGKLVEIYPLKESGFLLGSAPYDKAAILFFKFQNEKEMNSMLKELETIATLKSVV